MTRQVVKTKDNSTTLFVPELDEHYHSIHGALQESLHVFIEAGLKPIADKKPDIHILEVGFGTGLNALLTAIEANHQKLKITYTSIEKYPVTIEEVAQLNYREAITDAEALDLLQKMHDSHWEQLTEITPHFSLLKLEADLKEFSAQHQFDLIYFDAFAPSAQPNLWTIDIFERMYNSLKNGGALVTYCVKGEVRRNMKAAGFDVEKIPGPPGKREMARAFKRQTLD